MIDYRYRHLWRIALVLFGASMAWFSYAGLVEHLRPEIAIPVAITLPAVLSICFHLWHKTAQIKWAVFSFSMVALVACVHGISSNTHLGHEDSDLAKTVVTGAEASARAAQLATARADYASINDEVDLLVAEAAALESSLPDITAIEAEIAALESEIYTMDNDGRRWNDDQIPGLRAQLANLIGGANQARPAITEQRSEIAGKKALIATKTARAAELSATVATLSAGVTTARATATATAGREKFLFQLAARLAGGDSLNTQGLLAIGGLAGGLLVELIYGFCWMVPVAPRAREIKRATPSPEKTRRTEPEEATSPPRVTDPAEFTVTNDRSRFPLPKIYHNADEETPANVTLEERLQRITVGEMRGQTLSRQDEDKLLRRFNRFLKLGHGGCAINKYSQPRIRSILFSVYDPYEDHVTVGDILAGASAVAELDLAA